MNKTKINDSIMLEVYENKKTNLKNVPETDQVSSANANDFTIISGSHELFWHVNPNNYMWDGNGKREVRVPILFDNPMKCNPHVFLSISSIDSSQAHNLRYKLLSEDVSKNGFTAVFKTWSDTRISSASISWLAFGQSTEAGLNKKIEVQTQHLKGDK